MKRYKVIIFDLFDTLIEFNQSKLPVVDINGTQINSTSREVFKVFKTRFTRMDFPTFFKNFRESYKEFQELKLKEFREYHNRKRYKIMLNKMNIDLKEVSNEFLDKMVLAHMNTLASSMELPEENRATLEFIKNKGYRIALISNFDYAPTAYNLLEKFRIKEYFETVAISDEIGWRKPSPKIFQYALRQLNINSKEAIYIGDNYKADVVGARNVGMDVIWINRRSESYNDEIYLPNHIFPNLYEIEKIL